MTSSAPLGTPAVPTSSVVVPNLTPVSETTKPKLVVSKASPVKKTAKWYHGGIAGAMAVLFTHPFDLVKVQLQTQQEGKLKIIPLATSIVRQQGFLALYNGISASLLRQLTYTTVRFGVYEAMKPKDSSAPLSFWMKCASAGFSGGCGGFVGAPADLVNVRMQNDSKLPVAQRRNYRHALDGIVRVAREEGIGSLWRGSSMVLARSVLMTIGQLSFYDQIKQIFLSSGYFKDSVSTHLLSSSLAAVVATTITCPMDVLKTRMQNSGEYRNLLHCVTETAKLGPVGFFKGYIPAFVRIGPQTVLTFVFFEQLRIRLGNPVKT